MTEMNSKPVPLVSFLVPTYNRANLLQQSIDSILSQSYKNIEVIVIDDASTDDTEDMITRHFNGMVKYIKNSTNRGVAYSRNLGLNYAKGEYIGLLDSDDILYKPACVKIALEVLESDPRIGVFTCDAYCIDLAGNRIYEKTFFETVIDHRFIKLSSGIKDFDYVFFHGVHSCGAIFRKDITKEIGFLNTDYKIAWDEDFFLRVAACGKFKIYYYNEPLVAYRIHHQSFSRSLSELYIEKIKARRDIIKSNRYLKTRLGMALNKRLAHQYYCLSDAYIKENRLAQSVLAALRAINIYPPIIFTLIFKISDFYRKALKLDSVEL